MASHWDDIGLPISNQDEFKHIVDEIAKVGQRSAGPIGVRTAWYDTSGAGVAAYVDPERNSIVCAKPTFVPRTATPVRVAGQREDPNCRFCAMAQVEVLENGEMLYPMLVELDDAQLGPITEATRAMRIAAFAEEYDVHADEAA